MRPELIADKLGMNTRALYRRFKKISPLAPSDFIKDYRMQQAARLLVATNLSVQEIITRSESPTNPISTVSSPPNTE